MEGIKMGGIKIKIRAAIFDLDGTLANIDHRLHYIKGEKKDWDGFYREVPLDSVNKWCHDLMDMLSSTGIRPVLITARKGSSKIKQQTSDWFWKYTSIGTIRREHTYWVREADDYRPDTELKEKCLVEKILPNYDILFAVDDRESIAQVYRRHGIPTLVCSSWENDANRHDTQA